MRGAADLYYVSFIWILISFKHFLEHSIIDSNLWRKKVNVEDFLILFERKQKSRCRRHVPPPYTHPPTRLNLVTTFYFLSAPIHYEITDYSVASIFSKTRILRVMEHSISRSLDQFANCQFIGIHLMQLHS